MWNKIVNHPDIYLWTFAIGIVICLVAILLLYRKIIFLLNGCHTEGIVTHIDRIEGENGTLWSPKVEFSDPVGEKVEFSSRVAKSSTRYKVGDTVNVIYSVNHPEKAYIYNIIELLFLEVGLSILGVGWAWISFTKL